MWRLIETAPQDGTSVLLYIRQFAQPIVIGSYVVALKAWQIQHHFTEKGIDVHLDRPLREQKGAATHWMFLPVPPADPVASALPPNILGPAPLETTAISEDVRFVFRVCDHER